ncbi:MAG: alpha/beta hydrolase [Proteobacteria bacterium]|nr:alpha/beta hydrolase [Pseudomonadota bacterium]MBU1737920.1 alpha/beta hydrolase [Pseudomonadota bacterium]
MKGFYASMILVLALLTGCMKQIPYEPSQIENFFARSENIQLEFTTDKGRQVAFYVPPIKNPDVPPERIALLYPGIESVALGWMRFIEMEKSERTGYLLIDYPGRGLSEGTMRPEENYLNSEGALLALAKHFGLKQLEAEYSLMGHSFGTGAALQFAARHPVRKIVLVAPFTTLRKAVAVKSWILSILMPAQIDNRKLIQHILSSDSPPEIIILHGAEDTSLPVTMGRELAAIDPERIVYHEFPEDDHVTILTSQRDLIFSGLNGSE